MRLRVVSICAALLVFSLCLAVARAVEPPNHPPLLTITVGPPTAGPLKDACGVAVDSSGRIFVANYYDHSVYIFSEGGGYISRIPIQEPPLAPTGKPVDGPCDLAVDSTGNLYVNNWHRNVVKYSPTGPTPYGSGTVIDENHSTGVTVDPATDNVFVDDRTYVAVYEPSGAPVEAGGNPVQIGLDPSADYYGVAVSAFPATKGRVYVADASDNDVKVFNPAGALVEAISGDGTQQGGFNHLADSDVAVDPLDGHLYVVDNLEPGSETPEAVVDEFSPLGHYRGPVPHPVATGHPSTIVDAEPSAVAISDGDVYVTSGNYFNDQTNHEDAQVQVFGPTAPLLTHILTVSKAGSGVGTVFSSDPAGLGCGAACEGEFPDERTVTLVAAPAAHNSFTGWTGCDSEPTPERCVVEMDADHAVGAEFEPVPQLHLTVTKSGAGAGAVASAPSGIECGADCGADFDESSDVTLSATPSAQSEFAGWSGCDSLPSPATCLVTMSAARSVTAEFARVPDPPPPPPAPPAQQILSVLSTGVGTASGTVTSEPGGIDCGASCAHPYDQGITVTLTARPDKGSSFLGWGGCDSAAGARCTVQMGEAKSVVAAFGPGFPGALRVRGLIVRGHTATIRVSVPAPGALSASGRGLRLASALPITAGEVGLRLHLNEAGLQALQKAKHGKLKLKVALAFVPFDGGTTVHATKAVTFERREASQ